MKATSTRNYYEVCLIPSKITSTHILPSSYFRLGGGLGGGGGGGRGSRDFQENRGEISPN